MSSELQQTYEDLPYQSSTIGYSHPRRLAMIGTLFGMQPTNINRCRILELGCAEGGNLIPMAAGLPESEFVGIDFSDRQIRTGLQTVQNLGIDNLSLRQMNILDVDDSFGRFDYIIVHGIYTWVPLEVRAKILEICRQNLNPQGIGFVSFNAKPGSHLRIMIREMILQHLQEIPSPQQRAQEARRFLKFLLESASQERFPAYYAALKWEQTFFDRCDDLHLLHGLLETINDPISFTEFMNDAQQQKLQFLGEVSFQDMVLPPLPASSTKTLNEFVRNQVDMEQYHDYIRGRSFRKTLLCHEEVPLTRTVSSECVRKFHIGSPMKPTAPLAQSAANAEITFRKSAGNEIKTSKPLLKAAFHLLAEIWPENIPFDALLTKAQSRETDLYGTSLNPNSNHEASTFLADQLMRCYSAGLVEFDIYPTTCQSNISRSPRTTTLIQKQARISNRVANQRHETISLNAMQQFLLTKLDGSLTREQLLEDAAREATLGSLRIDSAETDIREPQLLQQKLANTITAELHNLAKLGLLIG